MTETIDEAYDTQLDVERDPCGAWLAIQVQAVTICSLTAERDAALAREADLRQVLQPFSDRADAYDPEEDDDHHFDWSRDSGQITLGQLRNARAALAVKL